jgi:hypothetical protein
MATSRQVLAFARGYALAHPAAEEDDLRSALRERFLGEVAYGRAALGAAAQAAAYDPQWGGLAGCLAALVMIPVVAPVLAAWDRLTRPGPDRVAGWIEAAVRIVAAERGRA